MFISNIKAKTTITKIANFSFLSEKEEDNNEQKEEVEDAKWCSIEEIKEMIDEDKLYRNHIDAFEIAMNYLNNNKI